MRSDNCEVKCYDLRDPLNENFCYDLMKDNFVLCLISDEIFTKFKSVFCARIDG